MKAEEVFDWTEESVVTETGGIPELDVKLTVVSGKDQSIGVYGTHTDTHTHNLSSGHGQGLLHRNGSWGR